MHLESLGLLPYYKLEKTNTDKEFFFSHVGFYNFWDTYLILNSNVENKVYYVIVDRVGRKYTQNVDIKYEDKHVAKTIFANALHRRCPKEMFNDFSELNNLRNELLSKEN